MDDTYNDHESQIEAESVGVEEVPVYFKLNYYIIPCDNQTFCALS